jgi:hypothetical protein
MNALDRLPGVLAFGVSLPLDEVLQASGPPMTSVAPNGLDLVLFFAIHEVRWGPREVLAVFYCLDVWGKEGCVEHGMDVPRWG